MDLTLRRRRQLRFKLLSILLPLVFLSAITYGLGHLVLSLLGVDPGSTAWWITIVMFGMALLSYYAVGIFAGSLRLDGNVISIISRMDIAEKRALAAVLEEVIKDETPPRKSHKGSNGSLAP